MQNRKYYEAYDERYKTVHAKGIRWFGDKNSQIVSEIISKYNIDTKMRILEIGCGEGRDAQALLNGGYNLLATDISTEVITYCKNLMPSYQNNFKVLDCIKDYLSEKFDFIYAVAIVHMLVLDEDRNAFYQFIYNQMSDHGIALICTMGDGKTERQSDINTAFDLQPREYEKETILVAGTSCRMVSNETFEKELLQNRFEILERGQTSIPAVFDDMMYAVVKKKETFTQNHYIRKAVTQDICRLAEIEIFNYRLHFYPLFQDDAYYFSELQVSSKIADYEADREMLNNTYVYDDGVVKGFIRLDGKEVKKLFVEPVLQNQAIGTKLLEYAIQEHKVSYLWALEKNEGAIKFYARHRFQPTGEKRLEEGTAEYLLKLER